VLNCIIIISKTSFFFSHSLPWKILADLSGIRPPDFHIIGFYNNSFLQMKIVSLVFNHQPGGQDLCIYVSSDRVVLLHSQAPGSLLITCDSQGYSECILTSPTQVELHEYKRQKRSARKIIWTEEEWRK
jgi:hypothetical protein